MAGIAQQRPPGLFSGRRYGDFSGKTSSATSGPHPVVNLTQQRPPGLFSGRRYGSFAGKAATFTSAWDFAPPITMSLAGVIGISVPGGFVFTTLGQPEPPSALDIFTVSRVELARKLVATPKTIRIDFLSLMPEGVSISAVTITASVFSGDDATPSAILSGLPAINGTTVEQLFTGGLPGVIYQLTFSVLGDDGGHYKLIGLLPTLAS